MAVILRYFTEFGKHMRSNTYRVDLWRNLCTSLLYFVVRARCRRKESSRSVSHLLMSFLYDQEKEDTLDTEHVRLAVT